MHNDSPLDIPLTQDVVLIGGGHSHALLLRKWAMRPLPGARLTLINPGPTAPYSGMLPGHIAGHYSRDALDIDLVRLARFAGARLIIGAAVDLDPTAQWIDVAGHGRIAYDVASLDIGVTSDLPSIPGFSDHATAAKPLAQYADVWQQFLAENTAANPQIAVIGGGVAGVELTLAMSHALRAQGRAGAFHLIEAQSAITGVSLATRDLLMRELAAQNVTCHFNTQVAAIKADQLTLNAGQPQPDTPPVAQPDVQPVNLPVDLTIGAAGARPHGWLGTTGLALTDGYVDVGPTLQVTGHKTLFAAGDCAHLTHAPRPKAGVFAVRAAPVLRRNIEALLTGHRLHPFNPQSSYLKLISLGDRRAVAEKWRRPLSGTLLWRWKDRIDQAFMDQFHDLPAMEAAQRPPVAANGVQEELGDGKPICAGCGSKVGPGALDAALADLTQVQHPDVVTGAGDDAAVLSMNGARQVLSTDHLRAFVNDPALMARIAAVHALGDIWSMGATPQSALAQIILPRMSNRLQTRDLQDIMRSASAVFSTAGATIVGGHTTLGAEMTIGFTVTGTLSKGVTPITHAGAKPGDALILTRAIGSGTLLAGDMQLQARGRDIATLLQRMASPQDAAARCLARGPQRAHAMTDVTGFGLAGHLQQICRASGDAGDDDGAGLGAGFGAELGAELWLDQIPLYPGALALAEAGVRSSLYADNLAYAPVQNARGPVAALLHDPQTAGGLLAAVAPDQADALLREIRNTDQEAAQIGVITEGHDITCR